MNLCPNDTMGTRKMLRTHFKEGKKLVVEHTDEHIATDHRRLNYRDSTVFNI